MGFVLFILVLIVAAMIGLVIFAIIHAIELFSSGKFWLGLLVMLVIAVILFLLI